MRTVDEIISKIREYPLSAIERGHMGFRAMFKINGFTHIIVVSWGMNWDHASVSLPTLERCPTWEEMCSIKSIVWSDEETVVQYHPAKKDYVNFHPFVLHLFKPQGRIVLPKPPSIMIGPKT